MLCFLLLCVDPSVQCAVWFDVPRSRPCPFRNLQTQTQPKGWSQVGRAPWGRSGASWARAVAPAWQGTKGQSVERPQERWLIEEKEIAGSLPGPCRGVGAVGGPWLPD